MVHSFDLRDLISLRNLTSRGISLDSPTCLTQDLHVLRNAVMAQVLPDLYPETLILDRKGREPGFAQLGHRRGNASAHLRFLAPQEILLDDAGTELIEALLRVAGSRQAQHILADAEEKTDECSSLRRQGFSVYARQDIWKGVPPFAQSLHTPPGVVRPLLSADASPAHALYCSIVPALVYQVEGFPRRPKGSMIFEKGELVGFFSLRTGSRGIWMEPFFQPGARNAAEWVAAWLSVLRVPLQDPVYFCVRSYQDWLGPILQDSGFTLFSRRAVLARRVVVSVPVAEGIPLSAVEKPVPQASTYNSSVTQNAYDSPTANHR
jgi:hypothetical protein